MTQQVTRAVVDAFYRAYTERDVEKIAPFIDDEVEWTISGPVDILPFCGKRHGKAAVLDLIERLVPAVFRVTGFVPDTIVVEGAGESRVGDEIIVTPGDT